MNKTDVRNISIPKVGALFDHFVGSSHERSGQLQAKGLCRLHVDQQLIFGRCLHRQVRRLFPHEDAIDIGGGTPELINDIRPVRDQTTMRVEGPKAIDRGQAVPGRKRDEQVAVNVGVCIWWEK